jgi:hypothetical protein
MCTERGRGLGILVAVGVTGGDGRNMRGAQVAAPRRER